MEDSARGRNLTIRTNFEYIAEFHKMVVDGIDRCQNCKFKRFINYPKIG